MSDEHLKDSLNFAVLTGCLRISKESIFSGFNNFKVYTIKDVRYKEYFDIDMSFSVQQISEMLREYKEDNRAGMDVETVV